MKKHLLFILALCAVFTACKGEVDSLKDDTSENYFVSYESDYGTLPDSIKNGIHVKENTVLTAEQLPELTADNMIFKGWYDGEIEAVAGEYKVTKNVTLTAFWDKNVTGPETVQVTVTLKADSETVSSIVKSAGEVIQESEIPVLAKTGYTFAGWFTEAGDNDDEEIQLTAGYTVTKDITFIPKWTANEYTITFNSNNAAAETASQTVTYDTTVKLAACTFTYDGYRFIGWTIDADGKGTSYSDGSDFAITITEDITLYAQWAEADLYIIKYENTRGVENTNPVSYSKTEGVTLTDLIPPIGYIFDGWYDSEDSNGNGSGNKVESWGVNQKTGDLTLYAKWSPRTDIAYKVEHWQQNIDDDGYTLTATDNLTGTTGTLTTAAAREYTGFSTKSFELTPIAADGSTVVRIEYVRDIITYTFYANDENESGGKWNDNSETKTVSGKYGATVTAPTAPVKTGFTFGSWNAAIPETFGSANATFIAQWVDGTGTAYKVEHWQQNADDDEYTLKDTENLVGTIAAQTAATAKTYTGFTAKSFTQTTIAADGSTVVRIEYDRNIITYTFKANGGNWSGKTEDKTVSGKYGATVTAPAAPVKTGFTFGSWNAAIPETFGSADATFIAQWVDGTGTAYKVEHWQQNADDDEYTLKDTENLVGTPAAQTAATAKTYDNFTAGTVTQTSIATDGSTVVKIYYTRNDVTLTLNLDGGVLDSQTGTVTITGKYGSTYTIETPVKTGYTFANWSSTLPAKLEAGTYTAIYTVNTDTKYTVEHYLQNIYDDGYFLDATDDLTGTTATTTNAAAKTYTGFTAKSFTQTTIAADGTSVVQIYYDRATATYTFNANGENESGGKWDDNSETKTLSGRYEAEVIEPDDPTKTGYTFSEWTGTAPVPSTFGTENLTFTASYTPKTNTEYKVKHYLQNEDDDEYRLVFTDYLTGTTAEQTDAEARTYEHFTADSFEQAEIAADGSTVVRINYNLETVTFTLDLDGGTLGGQTGTVEQTGKYGQTVNISAPTRTGYSFEGWNRVGGRLAPTFTTNTTYTAKWSAAGGISVTVLPISDIEVTNSTSHSIITFTAEECTSYRWTLDNEVKGTGRTCVIDTLGLYKGTYKISLEAQKNGKWHSYFAQIKVLCNKGIATTAENIVDEIMSMRMSGTLYVTGELNNTDISNIYTAITTLNYNNNNILVSLDLSQVTGLTELGNDFAYCRGLRSITIPNSVTSIGEDAFLGCSGLTSITIPNSVTSIGEGAFQDCSGLTSINIPNSVTSIGEDAFKNCSGLTKITIPNSVTSIGECAFLGCSGLTSITIPNSLTSIGRSVFNNCSGLTKINIPNSVTSIGMNAFLGCSGLTSIIIPNSVTSIGEDAFKDCTNLANVTFVTIIGWRRMGGDNINFTDLSNPVTAATYLKDNCNYTWTRD